MMSEQETIEALAEWYGCSTADIQKMIAHDDWCMWHRLEEKMMEKCLIGALIQKLEDDYLESDKYDHTVLHSFTEGYMKADLPTRCKAFVSVLPLPPTKDD